MLLTNDYDLFNFPDGLNDKLAAVKEAIASADAAPTRQEYEALDDYKRTLLQLRSGKTAWVYHFDK